ncbi:MAG: Gfo/Idh/MocA family oxidoreductase [Planctomycetota bacterium]
MQTRVQVGFLGAGNLNTIQHFPNVAACPDAEIYAVCDKNTELLEKHATPFHPKVMTPDFDVMLADPKVDIVWIATSPSLQARLARRAIEAGKNTFVEKPMAETMTECVELGKLAKKKGVRLFTGFNRRFAPAYQDLKTIMDAMKNPPLIVYRLADDSNGRTSAIFKQSQLIEEACHIFDILAFLTGSEPVKIYTFNASVNNDMVMIQYKNNAVAHITSSIQSSMAWPKERIEVLMDNAAVAIEDFVEMTTANVPGYGSITKRYQGNEYPGWLAGYKEKMEWEGLAAVLNYRRRWVEIMNESGMWQRERTEENDKQRGEFIESYKSRMPPVNYMVNKGWRNADFAILKALREKKPTQAAQATDAARAIACAEAAIESSRTGTIVNLDPKKWEIA